VASNQHDRALVIGIRRYAYPDEGLPSLQGPDNDARDVAAWLGSDAGGGVPVDNIRVVCSADVPDPFEEDRIEPSQQGLIAALTELSELPMDYEGGQWAGRRLYVYLSGHGWANDHPDAAVVTAEARRDNRANVLVSDWIRWMRKAALFQELVLWADTCATLVQAKVLRRCELRESHSENTNDVKLVAAFAARLGEKAVESKQLHDGQWHGAFTSALLEGLNGAAKTPVSTATLKNYLLNAMPDFMNDAQRADGTVSKEPYFDREHEIVFADPQPRRYEVTLRFPPGSEGAHASVASEGFALVAETPALPADGWTVELPAGVLFAQLNGAAYSKPFQVLGGVTRVFTIEF
jgi:hypothetical protein